MPTIWTYLALSWMRVCLLVLYLPLLGKLWVPHNLCQSHRICWHSTENPVNLSGSSQSCLLLWGAKPSILTSWLSKVRISVFSLAMIIFMPWGPRFFPFPRRLFSTRRKNSDYRSIIVLLSPGASCATVIPSQFLLSISPFLAIGQLCGYPFHLSLC